MLQAIVQVDNVAFYLQTCIPRPQKPRQCSLVHERCSCSCLRTDMHDVYMKPHETVESGDMVSCIQSCIPYQSTAPTQMTFLDEVHQLRELSCFRTPARLFPSTTSLSHWAPLPTILTAHPTQPPHPIQIRKSKPGHGLSRQHILPRPPILFPRCLAHTHSPAVPGACAQRAQGPSRG
jgi:hypothetical protein